jgi:hypothetical protein
MLAFVAPPAMGLLSSKKRGGKKQTEGEEKIEKDVGETGKEI